MKIGQFKKWKTASNHQSTMSSTISTTTLTQLRDQFKTIEDNFCNNNSIHGENDENVDLNDTNTTQHSPFVTHILNNKFSRNLTICKEKSIKQSLSASEGSFINTYQEQLGSLEVKTSNFSYQTLQLMQDEYNRYQKQLKTRRYSVDFDQPMNLTNNENNLENMNDADSITENSDDEIHQLRQRLLGKRRTSVVDNGDGTVSIDKQLQNHENIQENLVQDMSKLVSSLKAGAVAFQTALDDDEKILGAAEIGIQVASRGISNVGGKLKNYNKNKLGWLFYIMVTIFMIVGLLVTLVIVKLFPAL